MSKYSDKVEIPKKELLEIPPSKIAKLKSIGIGGYAEVFLGKWEGADIAIKQLHLKHFSPSLFRDFLNEAEILAKCRHPSIVQFFGVSFEEGSYQFILEYLSRGSLFQNLSDPQIEIPMTLRLHLALDISRGLKYLHYLDIVHRDLKSMNILLTDNWRAKITDFGLSKIKLVSEVTTTGLRKASTVRWCAPELFKQIATRTKESDVWSFGMIVWEIVSRKIPFEDEPNEVIVMEFIKNGEKEVIPNDCPPLLSNIISECWNTDPKERINASKLTDILESSSELSGNEIKNNLTDSNSEDLIFSELFQLFPQGAMISNMGRSFTAKEDSTVLTNKSFSSGKHRWMFRIDRIGETICFGFFLSKYL